MWEVRGQFNKPQSEGNDSQLEWSAIHCESREEAEDWWECRSKSTFGNGGTTSVSTMFDPDGKVVKVMFKQ